MNKKLLLPGFLVAVCVGFLLPRATGTEVLAQGAAVRVDGDDIGGIVTSRNGPEAGVWVIAETTELPTKFVRIVVTGDLGRYLLPDLPKATYRVWVRGYGLIDSPHVKATPGKNLDLTATLAPTPRLAAAYYPAGYWFSLLHVPGKSEFPGTGPNGNGIAANLRTQAEWVRQMKAGQCLACHQLGDKATREIPTALGQFSSSAAAWDRRVQSGQDGRTMNGMFSRFGPRVRTMFADWTDRIEKGELPPIPPRPQGIERNVVMTLWDWADPKVYLHDVVSTDRRNPRVNANGLLYGALEDSGDYLPVLDPIRNVASQVRLAPGDPNIPVSRPPVEQPSPYWGEDPIWRTQTNVHNPMFDDKGRVWMTSEVRPPDNPAFCRAGSSHPSAKLVPLDKATRHLAMYNPETKQMTYISTCYSTHHLMFAEDANRTLWTSSNGGQVVGWLNTKMFEETHDGAKSQGWTAVVLDTNGNGKRDAYVGPDQPVDPGKDKQVAASFYAVAPAPDGSVWGAVSGTFPGAIIRLDPGPNPSETTLAEYYEVPLTMGGFGTRGGDVDRNGVYWAALASGHLASFDRRKCKGPLNGPTATGRHCLEGWTLYPEPLPQFGGMTDSGSAESSYFTWVDQFNTLGLGANVPINTGNESEGLLVLKDGKWVVLRVPYPMGFYTKWLDGRIDDPNTGWKGRGLWTTYATRTTPHIEGGMGTTSKVVKFQLRPDPLAK